MDKQPSSKFCPRCDVENHSAHNFCWLCGISLNDRYEAIAPPVQRKTSVAAAVGTGIAGVLAGALGGIAIGVMIVFALIAAILNSIEEMFDNCAGMLVLIIMAASATIYSCVSWLF